MGLEELDSMKADEFSVWFSGVRRLSAGQRREVETEASAAGGATDKGAKRGCRPDALGMSGWRVKAVRIARDEQSSPGAARMGFRGSAAGAVGAPGVATKNLPNYLGWRRALEAWGDQATP
jgi:hypothetical protein